MSIPAAPTITQSNRGFALAVIGSVLLLSPLVGLATTIVSMTQIFLRLVDGEPEKTVVASESMSTALVATSIGLCASMVGLLFALIAIRKFCYTPSWLWSVLLLASALWIPAFIGIIGVFILLRVRSKFIKIKA